MNLYLNCTLALIALINPISKIFIISTFSQETKKGELNRVIIKSTIIAAAILISFTLIGDFLLKAIFRIDIYSLQIVGGFILLFRGFQALNKGLFFETTANQKLEDASIVPLASPMIAGPATITAAVSFPSQYGMLVTLVCIVIAVAINFCVMFYARAIGKVLKRYNLMGALIRITGLVVAAIGVQLMLDGISAYIKMHF
ncbi:MAG: MarC family protein [Candidatus Omnitrophica bacterium]|nr:MarC family protein [Candidatus Omnitrophota bacterium]